MPILQAICEFGTTNILITFDYLLKLLKKGVSCKYFILIDKSNCYMLFIAYNFIFTKF